MATTVQLKMTPSIRATRRTSVNEQFATLLSNTLPEKLLLLQPREISCSVVSFLVFHVITLLLNFPEGTRTIFLRTGPPDSRFVAVGTWQLAPKISRAKNISPAGCSEDTRRKYLSSTGPAACASLTVSLACSGRDVGCLPRCAPAAFGPRFSIQFLCGKERPIEEQWPPAGRSGRRCCGR
jgi:hypothetical protein